MKAEAIRHVSTDQTCIWECIIKSTRKLDNVFTVTQRACIRALWYKSSRARFTQAETYNPNQRHYSFRLAEMGVEGVGRGRREGNGMGVRGGEGMRLWMPFMRHLRK